MKTAGDAEAGEGEASAAAKGAAALCCAGAEPVSDHRERRGGCWRRGRRGRGRRAGESASGGEAGEAQKNRQMLPGKGGGGGGEGGGGRRGTKNRRMRAGRGLSRLTEAAAPRPGLWPDDEERAPSREETLWLDERAVPLCSPLGGRGEMCGRGRARECRCWRGETKQDRRIVNGEGELQ
jgi:hypothetical protein